HHHRTHLGDDLPLVYPLIFYNGEKNYPFSTAFFDLFGQYQEEMQSILTSPLPLIDIMTIPDERIRDYLWSGILEFVFKHRFAGNFMLVAKQAIQWLHQLEGQGGYDFAKTMLHYIINHLEGQDVNVLVDLAKENLSTELGDETMTFAQQLIQQ